MAVPILIIDNFGDAVIEVLVFKPKVGYSRSKDEVVGGSSQFPVVSCQLSVVSCQYWRFM